MELKSKKSKGILIAVIILIMLIIVGAIVVATGKNGIAKSVTFNQNMDGYYVYFRAVDEAGNEGEWSNAQRIWIDTIAPTVTAKEDSVTIKEGDVNNLADYFTVVANGSNDDIEVVCTIGGTKHTTTEELTVQGSPYTVLCTATKNGGKAGSAEMEIVVESAEPDFSKVTFEREEAGSLYLGNVPEGWTPVLVINGVEYENDGQYGSGGWHFTVKLHLTTDITAKFISSDGIVAKQTRTWEDVFIGICFVAGTKIYTPSGLINIEDIKAGDIVYSMNIDTMQVEEQRVEYTTKNFYDNDTCVITVDGEEIESTQNHEIYEKNKGWTPACKLESGDILIDGNGNERIVFNVRIEEQNEPVRVYNFSVENNHNYFVGYNTILVHNPDTPSHC